MDFMDEKDKLDSFYAFIEDFKTKSTTEKNTLAINELKEMVGLLKKMMVDAKIDYHFDIDRKLLQVTDDNYIDVLYTYINLFKDAFATYMLKKSTDLNE